MTRRIVLPLLAVVGVGLAVAAIMLGDRTPPGASAVVNPVVSPFATAVAGAGIVEASSENIAIGTPVSGIVTAIAVRWGDRVKSGDLLFKIDDRDLQGQLLIANAKVKEAEAGLAKVKNLLDVGEGLSKGTSISVVDLANRRFDVDINENDAWRIKPTAPAMAYVPGNPDLSVRLRFERIEPYAVPKVSLTGESTERTDTRVLQVIYSFERGELAIYIGQRMNVYIDAPTAAGVEAQPGSTIIAKPREGAR